MDLSITDISGGFRQRGSLCDNDRGGGGFWDPNIKFAVECRKARNKRHFIGSY